MAGFGECPDFAGTESQTSYRLQAISSLESSGAADLSFLQVYPRWEMSGSI